MQLTPFETHLIPVIAIEHNKLDGNYRSVHYFNPQILEAVAQKQIPSVPYTQPAYYV